MRHTSGDTFAKFGASSACYRSNGRCLLVASEGQASRCFLLADRMSKSPARLHFGAADNSVDKTVVHKTDGVRMQVDYGNDQTALVHPDLAAKEER